MDEDAYILKTSLKTRNNGLVMNLIVIPILLGFVYIDHVTPSLQGILPWRLAALVPQILSLAFLLFVPRGLPRLTIALHAVNLAGLMVMMCGITADLATRVDFPPFGRSALISSLILCIFAVFIFAGGARRYLFAILLPAMTAMSVYLVVAGASLSPTETIWLISNPGAMAIALAVLALVQERMAVKEFAGRSVLQRTEEALRESERKYHALFDNADVAMFRSRMDGSRMLEVNRKLLELFGRTRGDMVDRPSTIYWVVPRERAEMVSTLGRTGRVIDHECRLMDSGGVVRTCLLSARLSADGQTIEGSIFDITERRRLEAEREAVRQNLEFVIETTRTGLDIIDESFVVHYVDPARRRTLGDPHGRTCHEYFRGMRVPCTDCAMQRALASRQREVMEQTLPGQTETPTQVTALPYQDASGRWMVAEVIVDITERKRAEADRLDLERRVASAEKLEGLGILAGGAAHNFNNLLTVILGNAELLRDLLPRDTEGSSAVKEIIKTGFRSRDLVSQLLSLGRRQLLDLKPLDLNQVVRDCRTMLRQTLRENIAVDYRLSPSPCPVTADAGRIEEILLNLALNAQDAIAREGRLSIATMEASVEGPFARRHDDILPGRYVLLSVSDTGAGMDREIVSKIFDPFFTTKEPGKGTGLGLSTVYGIVKQHNGSIEVQSRPGAGTRFTIYLPWTEAPTEEAHADEPESPEGGSETILLVEDEEPIRDLLGRHLRGLGYTVLEAADGATALRVSAEHEKGVHLLVTDVVMPHMNGKELHDRLSLSMPGVKVLFMSGYPKKVISRHVMQDEDVELITKPFTGNDLASRVREILDARHEA